MSVIKSFFIVRSDKIVFSTLLDGKPRLARLKARRQVGGARAAEAPAGLSPHKPP
ncbi:hypothetical protein ABID59_004519 [Bradyrhizobium sp. S3.3.6]|uniref:hypothetical protein n=1 Tax=Bradyrhizobium sp. S3.3.6 TaxID=3156429 RepID=UPI00165334A6